MSTPQTFPLVSITAWSSGGTPSRSNGAYWNGTIPWISAATLKESRIGGSDQHLTEAGLRAGSNLAPIGATLVLVRGMALHREIRIGLAQLPVSFNQDVKALVPKAGILPEFLLYALRARSSQIRGLVSSAGSGTGVLNTQLLQRLPIWLPSEETQRVVVQALSDADDLIAALERLIVKQQAIKQGMAQQLLTGRTRLPGFTEPWSSAPFGDLGSPTRERVLPRNVDRHNKLIELEHVDGGSGRLIGSSEAGEAVSLKTVFRPGDVLFGKLRAYLRKYWLADSHGLCSTEIWALRARPCVAGGFIRYVVETDRFVEVASGGYGTHMPRSDWGVVRKLEISTPPINEQSAIAQVLADADAKIDALQARLTKARAIKTGMMQQLLTGRTRLPVEAAS